MAESAIQNPNALSPPPNCAICLGTCTNKCFSDSCMHQFCFKCLLEWSKVKAVCPLCKQPFTSIIHNVKSNNDYDEHFIQPNDTQSQDVPDENDFLYLPTAPPSIHFQFRTTFTVDPRGELAIQQMLLTHPLTNSVYMPDYNYSGHRYGRQRRRDTSSTQFRRNIYAQNMWVVAPPDVTGRYRYISPSFYRENPAAINRLVPWLNRELNALLEENTQQVMQLVDTILGLLNRHHIRSRFFKHLLREYLGSRTPHFIHEFYNFMRSPFDMVGYDRHTFYAPHHPYVHEISGEDESDNDIAVVSDSNAASNIFHRPTIEVIEINSDSSRDSDVIIHEPTPQIIVSLVDSDSDDNTVNLIVNQENIYSDTESKSKYSSHREFEKVKSKESHGKTRRRHTNREKSTKRSYSSSEESSTTDTSSNSSDNLAKYKYLKRKKKLKRGRKRSKSSVSREHSESSDRKTHKETITKKYAQTEDHSRMSRKKEREVCSSCRSKHCFAKSCRFFYNTNTSQNSYKINSFEDKTQFSPKNVIPAVDVPSCSQSSRSERNDEINVNTSMPIDYSISKGNYHTSAKTANSVVKDEYPPGPSNDYFNSNVKIKKERCNMWYSRPCIYDSDSSAD